MPGTSAGLPGAGQIQLKPLNSHMSSGHQLAFDVWRNGPISSIPNMDFGGDGDGGSCARFYLGRIQLLRDLGTEPMFSKQ